jgi:hypothetical protein
MTTPVTASRVNGRSTINSSCCRASPGTAGGKLLESPSPSVKETDGRKATPPALSSLRARASHMAQCVIAAAARCTSAEQRTRGCLRLDLDLEPCGPATQRSNRPVWSHVGMSCWAAGLAGAPVTLAAPLVPSPESSTRASQHLGRVAAAACRVAHRQLRGIRLENCSAWPLGCLVAWLLDCSSLDCWLLDAWSPARPTTSLVKSDAVLCTDRDRQSLAQVVTRGEMRDDGAPLSVCAARQTSLRCGLV